MQQDATRCNKRYTSERERERERERETEETRQSEKEGETKPVNDMCDMTYLCVT